MDIDFILTGQRIREARKFRGWTADFLAEKVGLATESLRHIENASSKPSLQTLYKIATELDVSLDYITGRTSNQNPYCNRQKVQKKGLRFAP